MSWRLNIFSAFSQDNFPSSVISAKRRLVRLQRKLNQAARTESLRVPQWHSRNPREALGGEKAWRKNRVTAVTASSQPLKVNKNPLFIAESMYKRKKELESLT